MGTHHKLTTNSPRLAPPRATWALRGRTSARLAHLASMEPATSQEATSGANNGVVIDGAFEPALSLKELALQLQVSIQTLYDLRSQGRGPTGFRVGRHLRFRQSEIEAWLVRMEAEDLDRHPHRSRR